MSDMLDDRLIALGRRIAHYIRDNCVHEETSTHVSVYFDEDDTEKLLSLSAAFIREDNRRSPELTP